MAFAHHAGPARAHFGTTVIGIKISLQGGKALLNLRRTARFVADAPDGATH